LIIVGVEILKKSDKLSELDLCQNASNGWWACESVNGKVVCDHAQTHRAPMLIKSVCCESLNNKVEVM
jgi:hypothetical protein